MGAIEEMFDLVLVEVCKHVGEVEVVGGGGA